MPCLLRLARCVACCVLVVVLPVSAAATDDALFVAGDLYQEGRVAEAIAVTEAFVARAQASPGQDQEDLLVALGNLSVFYADLGQDGPAMAAALRRRDIAVAASGEGSFPVAMADAGLADVHGRLGRHAEALPLLERFLVANYQKQPDDHYAAMLVGQIGKAHRALGQLEEARRCDEWHDMLGRSADGADLDVADRIGLLRFRRHVLGDRHAVVVAEVAALSSWAFRLADEDRDDEVLALRKELHAYWSQAGDAHGEESLRAMVGVANAHQALGQRGEALVALAQAGRAALEGSGGYWASVAVYRLADAYIGLGRSKDAMDLLEKLAARMDGKLDEYEMLYASVMTLLLAQYESHGMPQKLQLLREQIVRDHEALVAASRLSPGVRDNKTLGRMAELAGAYAFADRHEDARLLALELIAIGRELGGESHEATGNGRRILVLVYTRTGRHAEAIVELEALLAEARRENAWVAQALLDLAEGYRGAGDLAKVLPLQREALSLRCAAGADESCEALGTKAALAETYESLGRLQEAVAMLAPYVRAAEAARADPSLTADYRRTYFATFVPNYRRYARLLSLTGDTAKAFHVAELSKARTLLESTALQRANRSGVLPVGEQARLDHADSELRAVEDELAKAGDDPVRRLELDARLNRLQQQYAALQADLKARFPKYAALLDVRVLDATAGARVLPADTLFVSWLQAPAGWQIYWLDRSGALDVKVLAPEETAELERKVTRYHALLANSDTAETAASWRGLIRPAGDAPRHAGDDELAVLSRELGELLLAPLRGQLARYRQLVISPDGILATLPFETLPLDGEALVLKHDVTYAQSLSVYALLQARSEEYARLPSRRPLLAMGNPVYARAAQGEATRAHDAVLSTMLTRGVKDPGTLTRAYDYLQLTWGDLPGTARELAAVEKIFRTRPYTREQASEQVLRRLSDEGELARHRYLLFSAHGYLDMDQPALSALVLSQADAFRDEQNDGYISASEWPSYQLQSDLLVLSACETALGRQTQGEGVMGLPYALYVAGNKNAVLTLWSINDEASAEFVRLFFEKLRQGTGDVRALNETKREFIRRGRYRAPRYWAPFVMYGV